MHPIIPLIWIIALSTLIALLSSSQGHRTLTDVMAELDLHRPYPIQPQSEPVAAYPGTDLDPKICHP